MNPYLAWAGAELDATQWQGIEYLSMQLNVPGWAAVVTVHLARPANGMTAASVEVVGGRSITLEEPEIVVTNGSSTLLVRIPNKGDHSPYTVRLLNGGADQLHPFFAESQFRFYVECETGDCRPSATQPEIEPPQPPSVDTRYKDFGGFMRMLSEWVRVANPDWSDLSPASQELTLMELLAHQGDMLSYYQDRVANEAFLATASQRYSLRQHATLLGYSISEGQAARTLLAFETTVPGFVPEGLSVENRRLHGERPVVYYARRRTRIDPANNSSAMQLAAWPGASSATVPAGARTVLLWGQTSALLAGMPFAVVQGPWSQQLVIERVTLIEQPGWVADPADAPHTQLRPLTEVRFTESLQRTLRPWDTEAPLLLYANLVEASHGARRVSWINPPASAAPGDPEPQSTDVVMPLNRRNSIVVRAVRGGATVPQLRALQVPEGPVIHEDGEPVIEVYVNGDLWSREEHLHNSRSYDTHYTAATDNSGRLWLGFGDGVRGRAIEVDAVSGRPLAALRLVYRVGEPLDGNCSRDTLTEVVQPTDAGFAGLGVSEVTNVVPGASGQRKETLDEIRESVPMSLRHGELQRAVALADYAEIARKVDGVSRAAAKAIGGPFNTVLVLVDADDEAGLSDELKQRVWDRIDETRMAGREHFVEAAEYVPLRVAMVLCIDAGFLRHEVRDRVLAALRPGEDDRPGYFHPDNLTFGQDLEAGDLIAFVAAIAGVRSVKLTAFCRREAPVVTVEDRIVFSATEVARLDADDDFPENGILQVQVVGLDVGNEAHIESEAVS